MDQVHHLPFLSHEWTESHAELVARFKSYGIASGMAVLFAIGALFLVEPVARVDTPQTVTEVVSTASGESFVPILTNGSYLPEQFYEQAKMAKTEELPPQF